MTGKLRGIIIGSKEFSDKDILATIYTLEKGKITALFRGVRGEKAKLKSARQLFTFGDFFIENTKGNNIVSQVDVIDGFYQFSQDLDKYYEGLSVLDVMRRLGLDQPDPQFFLNSLKALKSICYESVSKNYVLCCYLIKVFAQSGYPINLENCSSCKMRLTGKKFFNFDFGEIVCINCRNYSCEEISQAAFSAMKILSNLSYDKLSTLSLSEKSIKELLDLLLKNFEFRFNAKLFVA